MVIFEDCYRVSGGWKTFNVNGEKKNEINCDMISILVKNVIRPTSSAPLRVSYSLFNIKLLKNGKASLSLLTSVENIPKRRIKVANRTK